MHKQNGVFKMPLTCITYSIIKKKDKIEHSEVETHGESLVLKEVKCC